MYGCEHEYTYECEWESKCVCVFAKLSQTQVDRTEALNGVTMVHVPGLLGGRGRGCWYMEVPGWLASHSFLLELVQAAVSGTSWETLSQGRVANHLGVTENPLSWKGLQKMAQRILPSSETFPRLSRGYQGAHRASHRTLDFFLAGVGGSGGCDGDRTPGLSHVCAFSSWQEPFGCFSYSQRA